MNTERALAHSNINRQPPGEIAQAIARCLAPGPRYVVAKRQMLVPKSAITRARNV